MRRLLIIILLLGQVAALGQTDEDRRAETPPSPHDRLRTLQRRAARLVQAARSLGNWEEQYVYMLDAAERVFERNGWDSESDLFSLEVFREVGAIPPWQIQERYDTLIGMASDRYLLDEDQQASLQDHFVQIGVNIFSRHSDRIMQYATEAIETRAAREPFTPEQVERWVRLAEPVYLDVRKNMNLMADDFMEELDPEQRELFQRDLDAANRRLLDVDRMAQSWKHGEWDPHDWGLEEDPIQMQGLQAAADAAGDVTTRPGAARARRGVESPGMDQAQPPRSEQARPGKPSSDDHPWAQYVRAFIRKYNLNSEQQQRAWLLYRDARERDEIFDHRYHRQMESLRNRAGTLDAGALRTALSKQAERHCGERDRLFNLLKRRLERLPTRTQRKNAEPEDIEVPGSDSEKTTPPEAP